MSENKAPHSWGFLLVKEMMGTGGQRRGDRSIKKG